jgi:hypothetical protein
MLPARLASLFTCKCTEIAKVLATTAISPAIQITENSTNPSFDFGKTAYCSSNHVGSILAFPTCEYKAHAGVLASSALSLAELASCCSLSKAHCLAALSGRNRRSLVPGLECNWNLFTLIAFSPCSAQVRRALMNGIIYLIGLIVVIMAILSLLGLR